MFLNKHPVCTRIYHLNRGEVSSCRKKKKRKNTRGKSEIMSRPVIERFCFCLKSSLEHAFYGTTFKPSLFESVARIEENFHGLVAIDPCQPVIQRRVFSFPFFFIYVCVST